MTPPHLKKSIGRSPLRLGFFLAALPVACFALLPFAHSAQAAEECNYCVNKAPNYRRIPLNFTVRPMNGQCTGGEAVDLSGHLNMNFTEVDGKKLLFKTHLENFSGKGLSPAGRRYMASDKDVKISWTISAKNMGPIVAKDGKSGAGTFNLLIKVTSTHNPAFKDGEFTLKYSIHYSWDTIKGHKKVVRFDLDGEKDSPKRPIARCD